MLSFVESFAIESHKLYVSYFPHNTLRKMEMCGLCCAVLCYVKPIGSNCSLEKQAVRGLCMIVFFASTTMINISFMIHIICKCIGT